MGCTGFTQLNYIYISKVYFFRYLYLLAFSWPDTETDSKNVPDWILIQIVKLLAAQCCSLTPSKHISEGPMQCVICLHFYSVM